MACQVKEIVVGANYNDIYMVMECVDHDLKDVLFKKMKVPFSQSEVCATPTPVSAPCAGSSPVRLATARAPVRPCRRRELCRVGVARRASPPAGENADAAAAVRNRASARQLGHPP